MVSVYNMVGRRYLRYIQVTRHFLTVHNNLFEYTTSI